MCVCSHACVCNLSWITLSCYLISIQSKQSAIPPSHRDRLWSPHSLNRFSPKDQRGLAGGAAPCNTGRGRSLGSACPGCENRGASVAPRTPDSRLCSSLNTRRLENGERGAGHWRCCAWSQRSPASVHTHPRASLCPQWLDPASESCWETSPSRPSPRPPLVRLLERPVQQVPHRDPNQADHRSGCHSPRGWLLAPAS